MIIQVPDPSGSPGACDSHESPPTAEHYALRCGTAGWGLGLGCLPERFRSSMNSHILVAITVLTVISVIC